MREFRQKRTTLAEFSDALRTGAFCIAVHGHADPDALGSAYAISFSYPATGIWAPEGLDRRAQLLAKLLDIRTVKDAGTPTRLLVVDTPDTAQLHISEMGDPEVLLLDHHVKSASVQADAYFIDETARSCSEIVLKMLEGSGHRPGRAQAMALLAGIMHDTGKLRRGDASTLAGCSRLLEIAGIDMEKLLESLEASRDASEQNAVLKGLERMRHKGSGRYFISWSEVSSFESSVAASMVAAGSDVALVASEQKGSVRISARCSQRAVSAGLSIASVLSSVSAEFGTTSGGHAGAAVLEGTGDAEAIMNAAVSACSRILSAS